MQDIATLLAEVQSLPEGVDSGTLACYWGGALALWEADPALPEKYADSFYELADRQWHSYELPSKSIQDRMAIWVRRVFTPADPERLNCYVAVIGSIGLHSCVDLITAAITSPSTNPDVAEAPRRELESWGPRPLDPWYDHHARRRNP